MPVRIDLSQLVGRKRRQELSRDVSWARHSMFSDNSRLRPSGTMTLVCSLESCDAAGLSKDLGILGPSAFVAASSWHLRRPAYYLTQRRCARLLFPRPAVP